MPLKRNQGEGGKLCLPYRDKVKRLWGKWKVSGFLVNLISTISIMKSSPPFPLPDCIQDTGLSLSLWIINSALRLSPTLGRFLNMHTALQKGKEIFEVEYFRAITTQDFHPAIVSLRAGTIVPRCLASCAGEFIFSRIINLGRVQWLNLRGFNPSVEFNRRNFSYCPFEEKKKKKKLFQRIDLYRLHEKVVYLFKGMFRLIAEQFDDRVSKFNL